MPISSAPREPIGFMVFSSREARSLRALSRQLLMGIGDDLEVSTPIRILEGIQALHRRGYHRVRAWPGIGGAGFWRVVIASSDSFHSEGTGYVRVKRDSTAIYYSSGALDQFANGEVTDTTSAEAVADLILGAIPDVKATVDDPEYVAWFEGLMVVVKQVDELPTAHDEGAIDPSGWKVGTWNDFVFYPHPPPPPRGASVH